MFTDEKGNIIMSIDAESEFHHFNINCRFLKALN